MFDFIIGLILGIIPAAVVLPVGKWMSKKGRWSWKLSGFLLKTIFLMETVLALLMTLGGELSSTISDPVLLGFAIGCSVAAVASAVEIFRKKRAKKAEEKITDDTVRDEVGESLSDIERVAADGAEALAELGKVYAATDNTELRGKINEVMRLTDMIVKDVKEDPDDLPKVRKYVDYYLPTTVKLLKNYERMEKQGIQGENIVRSMGKIENMPDQAIESYRKYLDSLFEDQALDVETDIDVLNKMLDREGLSDTKDLKTSTFGK